MKLSKTIVILMLIIIFSFGAYSQISDNMKVIPSRINDRYNLEEKQECDYDSYLVQEPVFGNVTRTRPIYTTCFDIANQSNYSCTRGLEEYLSYEQIGTTYLNKTRENCRTKSFVVNNKEVDFSSWGTCIQETEGDCVAVICGTLVV